MYINSVTSRINMSMIVPHITVRIVVVFDIALLPNSYMLYKNQYMNFRMGHAKFL